MNGTKRPGMGFETMANNRKGFPLTERHWGLLYPCQALQSQSTYHLSTHTLEPWRILQILTAFQIQLKFLFLSLNTL